MNEQAERKPKRIKTQPAMTVYLEDEPDASRRLEALTNLAIEMGADNRSRLIRMIADGEITLVRSSRRARARSGSDVQD